MFTQMMEIAVMALTASSPAYAAPPPAQDGSYASGQPWGYYVAAQNATSAPGSSPATRTGTPAQPTASATSGTTVTASCGFQLSYCPASGINTAANQIGNPASPAQPAVPTQQLALRAWHDLYLPPPVVDTAPPRGSDGWLASPSTSGSPPASGRQGQSGRRPA